MFSHALSVALTEEPAYRNSKSSSSILSLKTYSAEAMSLFLRDAHERTLSGWSDYLERRKQGHGPELFASAEQAKDWLVQQAPVKFVDGAWLGHVHKITTPFAFRSVTKHAWQVLSEELGDGDPDKHHVTLYRKLLESIGRPLPSGHGADFVQTSEWKRAGENHGIWESAVAQLAISLFPNEFLPEILGFNMHYEQVRLDTMQVAHELAHYGIDPYYFLIHISIDNADSGHTAMASHAVVQYLDILRATEGEAAVRQAWKRIQAGFGIESDIVAGMDEVRRDFCTSLVDIGLELTQKLSRIAISAKPQTLKQVFLLVASHDQGRESFQFANDMLQWSATAYSTLDASDMLLIGDADDSLTSQRQLSLVPELYLVLSW
ncbi:hypothetical protein MY5147_003850 [Beauveria neobassiana]